MKSFIIILLSLFYCNLSNAQITSTSIYIEDLKDAPFKFRGSRAMMVDQIDDGIARHIFVFSKIRSGSIPDTLFAQKFTKIGENWKLAQQDVIAHSGTISIWKSRKAFLDADKDGNVEALFIYSLHDATMQKQLSVHLLLMIKDQSYTINGVPGQKDTLSPNFMNLPENIKKEVLDYWKNLDKE